MRERRDISRRARRRRGWGLALAAVLCVGTIATAASAQDAEQLTDPYATGEQVASENDVDTDHTPQAEPTKLFEQVAGTAWEERQNDPDRAFVPGEPATGVIFGSPTSFEDNLYTVAFSEQAGVGGFAGGATCEDPEPGSESGCVPVLYQYKTFDPTHGPEWRKVELPGADDPGYIGAIAWIGRTGRALAVGGNGVYPRREPAYREECQQWEVLDDGPNGIRTGARKRLIGAYGSQCDLAGTARAWVYNAHGDGKWEELPLTDPSAPSRKLTDDTTASVAADRLCATATGLFSTCPVVLPDTKAPLSEPERTIPREGMHGLTAVACDPSQLRELCFAGALGQIWKWEDGRFVGDRAPGGRVDAQSLDFGASDSRTEFVNPRRFRSRVRAITFVGGLTKPFAIAVTAGCCTESRLKNYPRLLTYSSSDLRWKAYGLRQDLRDGTLPLFGSLLAPNSQPSSLGPLGKDAAEAYDSPEPYQGRPDSLYSVTVRRSRFSAQFYRLSAIASAGGEPNVYEPSGEPPSQLTSRYCIDGNNGNVAVEAISPHNGLLWDAGELTRFNLSTARLIAGDGDLSNDNLRLSQLGPFRQEIQETRGSPGSYSYGAEGCPSDDYRDPPEPDAVPDWVVGELRSEHHSGIGSRGLLVAHPLRPSFIPDAVRPPLMTDPQGPVDTRLPIVGGRYSAVPPSELVSAEYEPTSAERLGRWAAAPYFLLPSYGLNAIDIVGNTASGWAVGDHGAILRLSGEETTRTTPEPSPPRLGTRRSSELPDSSPYVQRQPPPSDAAGSVPALAGRPVERLAEPRVFAAGAPAGGGFSVGHREGTAASDVAMSRDGSEGWAVGPSATLYRYDGQSWTLCDFFGVRGQLPPDPACADVSGIRLFPDENGILRTVELRSIARVPLESDSDPTNDEEFEAVAVGSSYIEHPELPATRIPTILRYRGGRWRFEDTEARDAVTNSAVGSGDTLGGDGKGLIDVAFTAPDDGWMLASEGRSAGSAGLFHYDGEQWADCDISPQACSDPEQRLSAQPLLTVASSRSGGGEIGLEASDDRVYLFATRQPSVEGSPVFADPAQNCPAILYHERGEAKWRGSPDGSDGSFDPGFDPTAAGTRKDRQCEAEQEMRIDSLAVGQSADGLYGGWAIGQFLKESSSVETPPELRVLRLSSDGRWRAFRPDDALSDYFVPSEPTRSSSQLMLPTAEGGLEAFVIEQGRLLRFDPAQERWEVTDSDDDLRSEPLDSLTYDGRGGFWATRVRGVQFFLHYTNQPPRPVFEEMPNPLGARRAITAAAPGSDGNLWLATDSEALYRYDRVTGWDRVRVSGWDAGQVVTRPSHATAIAINASGGGVVVGEDGRIADIEGSSVSLDRAAGTLCELAAPQPPCGTGRDLKAAALAPDGAAMVGGRGLALLWRPAGGEFRAIARPDAAAQTTITGISMPAADRAFLTTDTGLLFAGRMSEAGQWSWGLENVNERGDALTLDALGGQSALRAIAVDDSGHGYAVGDLGVILERTGDSERPWRRLDTPYLDSLSSVALSPDGEEAAIGGERGIVLTGSDERFQVARHAEPRGARVFTDDFTYMRPVVGLALLPGPQAGQLEAWGAIQGSPRGDSMLLHYASDPAEPLLHPNRRAQPLPDAAPSRPGELPLAVFGGTRCLEPLRPVCDEMALTDEDYEVYTQRIIEEIAARSREPGGPALALFSGDLADTIGSPAPGDNVKPPAQTGGVIRINSLGRLKVRRFAELVADRLEDEGVPLLGAVGGGDISTPTTCALDISCADTSGVGELAGLSPGENLAWREAMGTRPAPWGQGEPISDGELRLEPVGDSDLAIDPDEAEVGDVVVDDPDGEGQLTEARLKISGARTHYAADIVRGEERIARLVFVDTSLRSLAASDPIQNPLEARGQLAWLQEVLCTEGSALDRDDSLLDCTREPAERAIVVSNAPTYSYGPGQNQTALDATAFEQVLFEGDADLVISGRIGWNGLYYALSPLVHSPEPGGSYPERAPEPLQGGRDPIPFVVASGAGAFAPDGSGDAADGFWHGYTIVRLDPAGGETIVEQRPVFDWLHLAGDKRVLSAGERLRLDGWGREPIAASPSHVYEVRDDEISSAAITHRYDLVLADPEEPWVPCGASDARCAKLAELPAGPRSLGSAGPSGTGSARDDRGASRGSGLASQHGGASQSSAIAMQDLTPSEVCDPYLCLPESIGTIDRITGEVKAGNGKYPDTFAIAMLSVGDHVATYPVMFKKSPSFVIEPFALAPPVPAPPSAAPNPPQPPAPPNPPQPNVPQPNVPDVPPPPPVPPIAASEPPEPQPPAPPAPPPPTEQLSPLSLTLAPPSVVVATPTAVIQPPTPPVNPAPPGGARREARQRQAATQKSGADSDQEQSEIQGMVGDLAPGPPSAKGAAFTRHDHSFTALSRSEPSAERVWESPRVSGAVQDRAGRFRRESRIAEPMWDFRRGRNREVSWAAAGRAGGFSDTFPAQGVLYGGGITLLALAAALGWSYGRPTPRSRPPEVPAPAWQAASRRRYE